MSEEIVAHIEMATEDNVRAGMNPQEARRQAMIRFGGVEAAKELNRDTRGLSLIESFAQDARYALRMLRRNAGFALTAVLVLALGLGAATAMFSALDRILFRPLPYADADLLMNVGMTFPAFECSAKDYFLFTYGNQDLKFPILASDGICCLKNFMHDCTGD